MTRLDGDATRTFDLGPGRSAWVHVARGSVVVNGRVLEEGDAASVSGRNDHLSRTASRAEVLVFDLA